MSHPYFKADVVAPVTAKKSQLSEWHGQQRDDPYAWLRDDNWQAMFKDPALLDADIRQHLEAENVYQQALMADTETLQSALFTEMRGRIKEDDESVPLPDGPWAYGSSYVVGGEHPRCFRIPRDGGEQQILIDGDKEAGDSAYYSIGSTDHSPDHSKLIWSVDDNGSEFYTLRVRDIPEGTVHEDVIENTSGSATWDADGKGFFYANVNESHRTDKIYYHRLGTAQAEDALIYEEQDPGFFISVSGSRLNDVVFLDINDHETSECHLLAANNPQGELQLVAAREPEMEYSLEEGGDCYFILTNADGAKDFKIVVADKANPVRESWQEVVPHQAGRLILSHLAYANYLVWLERLDGLPRIVVRERVSGEEHVIAFNEEAYSLGLSGGYEFDTETIRFTYSSMTTPSQQFEYDLRSRSRTLLKAQEIPSGHNPEDYVTRRLQVPTPDGEQVPVSLLYHKDTVLDGQAPCLLYGYGAYGISIPSAFSTSCLSLVDRGFVYAIAHIRGGKEKGFNWYEQGKREHKPNTFLDFIATARYLAENDFADAKKVIAHGGSAGGMLMGAVANMAPDAFGGVIAEVPFVDVLTTMLDETLPLTPPEWPEWGNPITSAEDYALIESYSPCDQVQAQHYPPILAIAGLTDPRVTYWEPAKWVARLRELKLDDNPVMFRINMESGHAGASGRFSRLEEVAYSHAFALKAVGLTC